MLFIFEVHEKIPTFINVSQINPISFFPKKKMILIFKGTLEHLEGFIISINEL